MRWPWQKKRKDNPIELTIGFCASIQEDLLKGLIPDRYESLTLEQRLQILCETIACVMIYVDATLVETAPAKRKERILALGEEAVRLIAYILKRAAVKPVSEAEVLADAERFFVSIYNDRAAGADSLTEDWPMKLVLRYARRIIEIIDERTPGTLMVTEMMTGSLFGTLMKNNPALFTP
jgi:hypothetical protein